jgi:hypothetical protein
VIRPLLVVACGALLLAPSAARAAGPSCHCFRDREYNPAEPAASDVYLLATASNTLLAAVSGIPKREIVQSRMSGTSGEDLWIAAHGARRRHADPRALLQSRERVSSWRELFGAGGGDVEALGPRFVAALAAGAPDTSLARIAAAEALAEGIGTPWGELDALAARGATYQETIVASLIGLWARTPAPEVYAAARDYGDVWSSQLAAVGRVPKLMESEIPASLRSPPPAGARAGEKPPR